MFYFYLFFWSLCGSNVLPYQPINQVAQVWTARVSIGLRTFEPVFILLSALQLRSVLQVQQQVIQDFTPLRGLLIRQEPFRRLNETIAVQACAQ